MERPVPPRPATDHVSGAVPPLAVNVNGVIATLSVSALGGHTAGVMEIPGPQSGTSTGYPFDGNPSGFDDGIGTSIFGTDPS